jgi:hypothetical protein
MRQGTRALLRQLCDILDEGIGIPQQHLHRGRRGDPVGTRLEHQYPFLVGHRRKSDSQPVALSESFVRIAGVCGCDPGLVRLDDLFDRTFTERVVSRHAANRIANLGIGKCQHLVAQDLVSR